MSKYFVVFLLVISLCNISSGFEPIGSVDELYSLEKLPLIREGVKCKMFSSYDRTGGNNDGFAGTYSKLREEDGDSVIAEMEGHGCIQRIWFTHSVINKDGLLNLKKEHIKVYLDGSDTPTIDVPLEDLFSGNLEQFPKPLVGSALGGFYCYVPIPYRNGCKVVIEGTGVRFYQVTYNEFPEDSKVKTFSMDINKKQKKYLSNAVDVWSNLGDIEKFNIKKPNELEYDLNLKDDESISLDLPKGKIMVRAVILETDDMKNAMEGRISFTWDNSDSPAVDVPIEYLFGQDLSPSPYQSLLMGKNEEGFYNFMPMPYLKSGEINVKANKSFKGTLKVILQPVKLSKGEFGYFHAIYHEQVPTEDGLHYIWLNTTGTGHFIGVYMVTEGAFKQPVWLEGDEKITVNDELLIHGTGTEDYFNCGWYAVTNRLNEPGALPLHGFPVYGNTDDTMQATPFRWHVTDPVPYEGTIKAKIEHGPKNDTTADYKSGVYFYDTKPGKIKSKTIELTDDECINYLQYRIFQMAAGDPEASLQKINDLYSNAKSKDTVILLEGLRNYLEGIIKPNENSLAKLKKSLDDVEKIIGTKSSKELYEKSNMDNPTDNDNPIPISYKAIESMLQRACCDLERRISLINGFPSGSEIIIEARDPFGSVTTEPFYKETDDFMSSYAKVDDIHLLGKGARFTQGADSDTWARFTPDFPRTGKYEVFVVFSYGSNASNTKYMIKSADGEKKIPLEQRGRIGTSDRNNKKWISLGTYEFTKGQNPDKGSVTLLAGSSEDIPNKNFDYRAYSDSVRFVFKGE